MPRRSPYTHEPPFRTPAYGHRMPRRPHLDRQIDEAYLRTGNLDEARDIAERQLGWAPDDYQLEVCIGRHAWTLGERRGDQRYQLRQLAAGRYTPRIDPDGVGAETFSPEASSASIDRGFGLEIEFNRGSHTSPYGMRAEIVQAMNAANVPAHDYGGWPGRASTPADWRMGTDGTVTGGEFVSPILTGVDGHRQVRVALQCVRDAGGSAGQGQGMHVHHDVRDHTPDELIRLLHNLEHAEQAILNYCPRYRWDGSGGYRGNVQQRSAWTRYRSDALHGSLVPNRGPRDTSRGGRYARYVSFNINAVLIQGSIEFRSLGNTLNAIKVRTWIRVGQALVAWSLDGGEFGHTVDTPELLSTLVDSGHLPQREADRFNEIVNTRLGRTAQVA